MHLGGTAAVQISAIGAKGRDFHLEAIFQDHDDAEVRADRVGARKDFLHFFRTRGSGDVEILRRRVEEEVAHAAAGEIGDVTRRAESVDHPACRQFHRRNFVGAH